MKEIISRLADPKNVMAFMNEEFSGNLNTLRKSKVAQPIPKRSK
jgi:hypothetical protein